MRVLTADLGAQSRREAADPLKAAPDPGRNGVIAPNVRSQAQAGRVELPVTTRYSHGVRRTNSWRARWPYLIIDVDIHDEAGFEGYRKAVPTLATYGGEYLVRGGEFEIIEGDWRPHRLVLFRFPDRGAIRAFFADPRYAELLGLRQRTADAVIVAVDGIA
jgi:uncharacterized protein (DUF1330 family)